MSDAFPQNPTKACLPPVVDRATRLLILGSLPGEASLAAARYYAHPRNQFWRLLEHVTGEPLPALAYDERLEALRSHRIGLWDTVATAARRGSLDGALRSIAANPLQQLVAILPELRAVAFNGGTAARIGRRELGEAHLCLIDLPSSSPALTWPFERKADAWSALRSYLGD